MKVLNGSGSGSWASVICGIEYVTSMPAPHVAGVAALVVAANTGITPAVLEAHLNATGECPDRNPDRGLATCSDQGTWNGDPDGIPESLVDAHRAATTTPGSDGGARRCSEVPDGLSRSGGGLTF